MLEIQLRTLTKNLQAVMMLNMPMVSPCQYDPAVSAVNMIKMAVDSTKELVLDHLSDLGIQQDGRQYFWSVPNVVGAGSSQIPKDELTHDSASEGDVAQIMLRVRVLPQIAILYGEDGNDGSNDIVDVPIREKSSTASNHRQDSLFKWLLGLSIFLLGMGTRSRWVFLPATEHWRRDFSLYLQGQQA